MRIKKETFEALVYILQEANEWAHKNKNIEAMDFIQDATYEALVFLEEIKPERKNYLGELSVNP